MAFRLTRSASGESAIAHRIPSLDGLRGIAIWAVMLAHASAHFPRTLLQIRRVHDFLNVMAYFGVTIFFVISGFLITILLLREHTRTSRIDLGRFYRRRALRILPAALIYIGIVLIFARVSIHQAFYALTFTTSYFFTDAAKPLQQLWSLSVEEQFYLLWPLAFCFGVQFSKRCCWAIMLLSPIVRVFLKHYGYTQSAHLAPAIGDSLAAGCLLAFYQGQLRAVARKYLRSTAAFLMLCAITISLAAMVYWWDLVLLWGLVPCLIALVVTISIERRDSLLNNGALVWTGLLSYSLYLWQQIFMLFDGPLNYFLVRIGMTFAVAYLSYSLIEKPLLRGLARNKKHADLASSVVSTV